MRVAVLGTGTMGAGMARSLLRAGHEVTVWNRSAERAQPLAGDGARVAASATEAVWGAEVVVTMLFDADAVVQVVEHVAAAISPGAVWAQMSTVGVDGTARMIALADRAGLILINAPVLGTRQPAEQGTLVVLAAGAPSVRERVQPAFDAMGSRTIWAGDHPGAGSALKLTANAWVLTLTAGVAQSLVLAAALGLDPTLFLDAIDGGVSDSRYAHVKGKAMLSRQLGPQFALDGALKDLGLIRAAVEGAGVDPALVSSLHDTFTRASNTGHGEEDMAAVITAFEPPAR